MINSTSFAPIQSTTSNQMSSIMPMNKSVVVIDGKEYPVISVPDNDPTKCTFAQTYKSVVIIDGKQYEVETVRDNFACDKTKQVVVVDGQQYDVKSQSEASMDKMAESIKGLIFNQDAKTNQDSTISYMA